MTCPGCGEAARCVGLRDKQVVSLLGTLKLKRHYYHCQACRQGCCPWEELLCIADQRRTPAARAVVCLTAVQQSFGQAAERTLHKRTGLRLSESSVERLTEAAGTFLKEQQAHGVLFGEGCPYDWHGDALGVRCAYVSVDLMGILMQGEGASKVEGPMVTVGMISNPQPRQADDDALSKPCDGVRYCAGFYDLEELGLQRRRQAGQVGMNEATQWIALTDGGAGLERFLEVNFPRAEKILDFHHAAEHLQCNARPCNACNPCNGRNTYNGIRPQGEGDEHKARPRPTLTRPGSLGNLAGRWWERSILRPNCRLDSRLGSGHLFVEDTEAPRKCSGRGKPLTI